MDSTADDGLIHPAFQARISQVSACHQMHVSRMTEAAMTTLANTIASLRRTTEARALFPEVAQIASAVAEALTNVGASLQRWNDGEVLTSGEFETLATCLRMADTALRTARELCACDNVLPTVLSAHSPPDSIEML
jgi:hypothetical protein